MADTDIKLSVDLDITDADKTAQQLEKEIKRIFERRGTGQSASFTQLEVQMKQNLQKVQALRQELERLSKQKIPTEEYTEISKRLQRMNAQFDKLLIKQDEMQELGQTSGPAWEKLNVQMEQLGTLIREDTAELQQLVDTGKAFTLGSESVAYQRKVAALDGVNDKLKQQVIKYRELEDAEEEKAAKAEESNSRVRSSNNRTSQSFSRVGKSAAREAQQIGHAFTRRILPAVRSVRSAVSKMGHSLTRGIQPATKSVKRLAMRFLMLSLGARSLFALLRKIRTSIVSAFKDLEKSKISNVTKQVKELKASLSTMRNALVAAFEPIISSVIPYLQRLADSLTEIIDKIAQFIAALSGRTTYIKAIKQTGDAIEETGDQADKASESLAGFDKLNVISGKKETKKFEEANIEEEVLGSASKIKERLDEIVEVFKKFKNRIKKIINKIKIGQWIEAGADAGQLVSGILGKIIDWLNNHVPSEQDAQHLGDAIGEFIRKAELFKHAKGAINVLGKLFKSLMTTAFATIESFTDQELQQMGEDFGDMIIAVLDNIIWALENLPTDKIGAALGGLFSKSWEIIGKVAEALRLLVRKAFSVLWTGLTGDDLSPSMEAALGDALIAGIAAYKIGDWVWSILGGNGYGTGLLGAFKQKDKALKKQKGKVQDEVTAMADATEGVINWSGALALIPAAIGLVTSGLVILTETIGGKEGVTETVVKAKKGVTDLKTSIETLALLGQNSYTLSGIQAITNMLAGVGTAASNSLIEVMKLQEGLKEYAKANEVIGNTGIVPGTSGVTYNPNTGEVYSGTHYTSPSKAINTGTVLAPADNSLVPLFPDLTGWQIDGLLKAFDGDVNLAKEAYDSMKALDTGTQAKILENLSMYQGSHDKERVVEIAKALKLQDITAGTTYISTADAERLGVLKDIAKGTEYATGLSMLFNLLSQFFKGVPAFARGAVIPAGKPFLAMLGDQKSGTNVEAPLDTIKQALAEVLAQTNTNVTFQIEGDPHGMFRVIQKEAGNYTRATGRLAF